MGNDGLGGLAKRWVTSKVKELTTTDRHARDAAEYDAQESSRQFRNDAAGEVLMTAIPGLRRLRDRQVELAEEAGAERDRRREEELAARPLASLRLSVEGAVTGTWAGEIPAAVVVDLEASEGDDDPFGRQPSLVVDLRGAHGADLSIGGHPFSGWSFEVPGFTGTGSYDLAASGRARCDAGCEPEYIDWELSLGHAGEAFYFQPDIGPSRVEVAATDDGGAVLRVDMSLTGATGRVRATAEIAVATLPAVS